MNRSSLSRANPKPKRPVPLVPKATGRSAVSKKPWRSKPYRDSVKEHPCLGCGWIAEESHHIRECFSRSMGRRIGDEWCVPMCRRCHDRLHRRSKTFWKEVGMDAVVYAEVLQKNSPIWRKHAAAIEKQRSI